MNYPNRTVLEGALPATRQHQQFNKIMKPEEGIIIIQLRKDTPLPPLPMIIFITITERKQNIEGMNICIYVL
jgi:hypothetical protein